VTWTLPNILTLMRLLAAPMLALVFVLVPRPLADWIALGLFVGAAVTDWIDGRLARKWRQVSAFGTMLDPIADKAIVVIALALVMALSGLDALIVIPATIILFREVLVSGLREFLGADAARLSVTRLAKWKTSVQMAALALLLLSLGLQEVHYYLYRALEPAEYAARLQSGTTDWNGTWRVVQGGWLAAVTGIGLFWLAAALTAMTGWDYFRKAVTVLPEDGA